MKGLQPPITVIADNSIIGIGSTIDKATASAASSGDLHKAFTTAATSADSVAKCIHWKPSIVHRHCPSIVHRHCQPGFKHVSPCDSLIYNDNHEPQHLHMSHSQRSQHINLLLSIGGSRRGRCRPIPLCHMLSLRDRRIIHQPPLQLHHRYSHCRGGNGYDLALLQYGYSHLCGRRERRHLHRPWRHSRRKQLS